MVMARFAPRRGALGIVQQRRGVHDFQVGPFGQRQALGHVIYPFDVLEIMHHVCCCIPPARLLKSWHCYPPKSAFFNLIRLNAANATRFNAAANSALAQKPKW